MLLFFLFNLISISVINPTIIIANVCIVTQMCKLIKELSCKIRNDETWWYDNTESTIVWTKFIRIT